MCHSLKISHICHHWLHIRWKLIQRMRCKNTECHTQNTDALTIFKLQLQIFLNNWRDRILNVKQISIINLKRVFTIFKLASTIKSCALKVFITKKWDTSKPFRKSYWQTIWLPNSTMKSCTETWSNINKTFLLTRLLGIKKNIRFRAGSLQITKSRSFAWTLAVLTRLKLVAKFCARLRDLWWRECFLGHMTFRKIGSVRFSSIEMATHFWV